MIDFGMNVQQAIEAPRWSTRGFASSVFPHNMSHPGDLSVESRIPDAVQKALQAKGHKLQWVQSVWLKGCDVHAASGIWVGVVLRI
jgi:gamma-glutamyltranspeptidase/glutathione hydrolase